MVKSYKYRIYPTKKQQDLIQKTFGCARFVYNYFLDLKIKEYEINKNVISGYETSRLLTQLKKEMEWLKEPDKWALQNSLRDLDDAYHNFFKAKHGFPKFKSKKNRHKSYRTTFTNNNISFVNRHIKLPKLGWVKTKDKQVPQGRIINATISQEPNGYYYCSLCCDDVEIHHYMSTGLNVGLDLGIKDFLTMSNGIKITNPKFYEKSEQKIAKLQREMSRKTIGSSNYEKSRIKLAKLHKHIANQRKDFLQKLTTYIIKNYDIICIEDLKVSEIMELSDRSMRKRIADVSWSEFRKQLEYKAEWYGKKISVIDTYYPSSQICHICGQKSEKKTLDIRMWTCLNCGSELDRDINAAINILNEGLRII